MPYGKLHEFEIHGRANWGSYVRLVEQFILLNEIKRELRVATLVTHVGAATYELMCDLCAPEHPEDKQFEELVTLVRDHLEPKRSEIAERHIFRQRRQSESENVGAFLQHLKHLATYCNFGALLEENIRDQFVSGLRSEEMRSRLFAEPTLDYKKAVELALALEAAERHAEVAAAGGSAAVGAPGSGGSGLVQGGDGMHRVAAAVDTAGSARVQRFACWRCGKNNHAPNKCRYKFYSCNKCGTKGHLALTCKSEKRSAGGRYKSQNYIVQNNTDSDASDGLYHFSSEGNRKDEPYYLELNVENKSILFEVDTGSKIAAVSKQFYDRHLSHLPIIKEQVKFRSYSGGAIIPLGRVDVNVVRESERAVLPLFVIENGGPPLMGRLWLRILKLKTINLHNITNENDQIVSTLKGEFPEVFKEGIGTFKTKIKLYLNDTQPIFCKARPIPLALRIPVERELQRLQAESVIVKVDRSDYGTPIVPIIKRDGSIRICGDYKITVNKQLKDFHYPLPRIEQLFAALSGGEQYTKLDLKNAYLQLNLDESSQPLTAITTHVGVYVYKRAPFGLKCLPEIFQKLIEETLCGINNVVCFIDDICITGCNKAVHMKNLRMVLSRLSAAGLRIKFEKCDFFKNEVCYLGYRINRHGLYTDNNKVAAIANLPVPQNVSQLRAALGLMNYYARFLTNMSTTLHPLYALLAKGVRWQWTEACNKAFEEVKQQLLSGPALAHYDPRLPLVLAVDSSAYGLGAVLSQVYPGGNERIVCCASRTLNEAERRYSQIDKEALAIVYGVTRHHQYLFGRKFTLRSDHKALTYIFGPKHGIPQTAASRLQRYAVRLAAYDFNIVFVSTDKNGNADGLSRLPLAGNKSKVNDNEEEVAYLHYVENAFPLNYKDIASETRRDVILCKVYSYILSGWPAHTEIENEKPHFHRKESLQIDHGCIVWGYRIVIPVRLRQRIIEEIHEGHVGIVRMKQISRNFVWWPLIDSDLEQRARACSACREARDSPPHAPPAPYTWPREPWERLHADFLHYKGKYYLLVIDAHSKWIEVAVMTSGTSAARVIGKLREMFARFGLPRQLVTDGGPPFTSSEFEFFLKHNGVHHILTAPYHPSSNGAAENAVKTVKKVMKKAAVDGECIEVALNKFLLQYRNIAHSSTEKEPAVAMMGRRLRTRLDQLRAPSGAQCAAAAQRAQALHAGGTHRTFAPGDSVYMRNFSKYGNKWKEGTVAERTGTVTYKVISEGKDVSTKHVDQLISHKPKRYSWSLGVSGEEANSAAIGTAATKQSTPPPSSPCSIPSADEYDDAQMSPGPTTPRPSGASDETSTPQQYQAPVLRPRKR